MPKRMRLPNGFGQISKLNQRLRNPYRAMVTVGWTEEGKPERRTIGYFKTYNDAYQGLMEYHGDPHALETTTVAEVYAIWSERQFIELPRTEAMYTSAWKRCESLYSRNISELRLIDCEKVINADMAPSAHQKVKTLLIQLFDYAIAHDLADKNYAKLTKIFYDKPEDEDYQAHIKYSDAELELLWENLDVPCVNIILIQCYMGWRPGELCEIRTENVDLENWTITGGGKTRAGKNRTVPIHSRIRPLVELCYKPDQEYLFKYHSYNRLYEGFVTMKEQLGLNTDHKLHDGRLTFASLCKKYHVEPYARKVMMGHAVDDLTDRVYTQMDPAWFAQEIAKIS